MPTWPTNKPDSNKFNSDSDSIKQSRTELKTMSDAVNDIVDFIDTTGIGAGKVLVYNASNSRLEVGENLLNISAGTNVTIDQDSAGGITINAGGGTVNNPMTADLDTKTFAIGNLAADSAQDLQANIQFDDNGYMVLTGSGNTGKIRSAGLNANLALHTATDGLNKTNTLTLVGGLTPRIEMFSDDDRFIMGGSASSGGVHLSSPKRDIFIQAFSDSAGQYADSAGIDLYLNGQAWPRTAGSNGQILQIDGDGRTSWVTGAGGGISDVVSDTTPQLGGDLDLNGNDIVTVSNANLELAPNGSGKTVLKGNDNPGALQFNCDNNSHAQVVQAQPHSAGVTNNLTLPAGGDQELVGASATQTLTNKRLTSPKINEDVALTSTATELNLLDGITGIADEDNMSSDSNTKLATQQSIKAYVDAEVASAGGGGATGDVSAGNNISLSNPDSAGQSAINLRSPFNQPVDAGDQQLSNLSIKNYGEIVHDLGTTGGTLTPDPNNGSVQKVTLNNNLTLNSLSNVASGDSLTLLVTQDGTGNRTLSSTMKFAGGTKTLSTGANAIDVITIFYDGTNYLASLSTNFS